MIRGGKDESSRFGAAVRSIRERKRMTQAEVAERAGWRQDEISRLERGHRLVSADQVLEIAYGLKVKPSVLFAAPEIRVDGYVVDGGRLVARNDEMSAEQREILGLLRDRLKG